MSRLQLNQNNEVALKTSLSKGQIAKFNAMQDNLVIRNGIAYISTNELHGVLLTRGRKDAKAIITEYRNTIKNYFVQPQEIGLDTEDNTEYIRPVGLYILLEELATDKPQKALNYRASHAFLACIVAGHPQLVFSAYVEGDKAEKEKNQVMMRVKNRHNSCQISGHMFAQGEEKHVHHIEPQAVAPALIADEDNLIVISKKMHDDYHDWIRSSEGLNINRKTLRNFCRRNGYSLDWDIQGSGIKQMKLKF